MLRIRSACKIVSRSLKLCHPGISSRRLYYLLIEKTHGALALTASPGFLASGMSLLLSDQLCPPSVEYFNEDLHRSFTQSLQTR